MDNKEGERGVVERGREKERAQWSGWYDSCIMGIKRGAAWSTTGE